MSLTYDIDPADPRAPSQEEWERMAPSERDRALGLLPSEALDPLEQLTREHHKVKASVRQTLTGFFCRERRRAFVAGDLNVYYPGEPGFAPAVLVALDVEPRPRERWVVSQEGKGIDVAIDVYFSGDPDRLFRDNVARFARLGISEYFIFDCLDPLLCAFRLPAPSPGEERTYRPILPEQGRFRSKALGLDLTIDGSRLRWLRGDEPLPDGDELIAELFGLAQRLAETEAELATLRREAAPPRDDTSQGLRFERHEGSGYPLRVVYADGSWLAVNRDHRGLFVGEVNGRIVQLLAAGEFHATNPRQFALAFKQVFGEALSARTQALSAQDVARLKPGRH